MGEFVGEPVGKKYPSRSVAVPPEGTLTVVGSVPTVCWYPGGKVVSSMSITVDPIGTSAMYIPVVSVVKVKTLPSLSVISTLTPGKPGSLGSWTTAVIRIFENSSFHFSCLSWQSAESQWARR